MSFRPYVPPTIGKKPSRRQFRRARAARPLRTAFDRRANRRSEPFASCARIPRSFADPSLVPAHPLFGDASDFFRGAATIAALHRDGRSGGGYFVERGCLFGADAVCRGLTRRAPLANRINRNAIALGERLKKVGAATPVENSTGCSHSTGRRGRVVYPENSNRARTGRPGAVLNHRMVSEARDRRATVAAFSAVTLRPR